MRFVALTSVVVATMALGSTSAFAGGRTPGSLLVFPIFDSQVGVATVITVTNTNPDTSKNDDTGLANGSVYVEYRYIDAVTCAEFNRTEFLTPNDTLSVIATDHNAEQSVGYAYAYAKNGDGDEITFNWLIGSQMVVDGIDTFEIGINAFSFNGETGEGNITDVDDDGHRDMDGVEYEQAPAEILVPRFFGQGGLFTSELVLVNLTGGTQFLATLDFLVYNDNEQAFSAEYSFICWARTPLADITGAFEEQFLDSTNNDPNEIVGLPAIETGWFRIDGGIASSSAVSHDDPAFLAVLIENVGSFGAADLPFELGTQDNGDLLPRTVQGDQ